jgi:hypothetical protein
MVINIRMKKPDFILIDIQDYVDVYEIKKPNTELLGYDNSRSNFYWSPEMSKAISQVEKYLDALSKNAEELRNFIKGERKIDSRIIRPRGYVIAGTSKQFEQNEKKKDDFRVLCQSLKNTEVLPYDIFLKKFKAFSDVLKKAA